MSDTYYANNLNAERLRQAYETSISEVKKYLEDEIDFVAQTLTGREKVLELGCGYGRVLYKLAATGARLTGIDNAADSIAFGRAFLSEFNNVKLQVMDAHYLEFENEFEVVICLQNGLSALKGQPLTLIEQALKALVTGGRAYFSTYSPNFWEKRLEWFQEQADKNLIGPIDQERTGDGVIVCRDGFKGITFSAQELRELGQKTGKKFEVREVAGSSLFLILTK